MKELLELFWVFFIIGSTTFGGGYAMLPVLERELLKKRGWVTMDEIMDYFTVAQITPGIIMVNVATFVGYKRRGISGGIVTTLGIIFPGICLMLLISVFVKRFTEYQIVRNAFIGIRIAVGALLLSTVLGLFKGIFKNYKSIIIYAAAFILLVIFRISPVFIILGAALSGFLFFRQPVQEKNITKEDEI